MADFLRIVEPVGIDGQPTSFTRSHVHVNTDCQAAQHMQRSLFDTALMVRAFLSFWANACPLENSKDFSFSPSQTT